MEKNNDKNKAYLAEIIDLLAGAAFPLMLQLILGASIISYAGYGSDAGFSVLAVAIGEILLVAAYFVFGRQNGITAKMKSVQQEKKRMLGTDDIKALYKCGEYAVWKGVLIGFITCLPFIIFQIANLASPNQACLFALKYVFGWAYYPFTLGGLSQWFNFICVIILVGIHAGAYVYGGYKEDLRQKKVAEAEELRGKKRRK